MATLLFIWAILTTPTDRYICDLWTNAITREGVISACGVTMLEGLQLNVYTLNMVPVCQMDASYLNNITELQEACGMYSSLDQYHMQIVDPGYSSLICYVETDENIKPTDEEIALQCPQAVDAKNYVVEYAGTRQQAEQTFTCPARAIPNGFGLYDQPLTVTELLTTEDLTWLAGKLIWSGIVKTNCTGASVDPKSMIATPCGMAAAREHVIKWQNQFDAEIYAAALAYNIPAKLLKRIMLVESQLWPFYTEDAGEIGIMQITDNGIDVLMRFDGATIDPYYFDRGDQGKLWSRAVTRDALACYSCTLTEAVNKIKKDMPIYARLIAAYHCRAVTINPALAGIEQWQQTVIDYNGSGEYLERIEQ